MNQPGASPVRKRNVLLWGAVLLLTLLQSVIWWRVTPPWTAPDEPSHYLYVRLYAELGRTPTRADITPQHWNAILASLERNGWREYLHPGEKPAGELAQTPELAASGLQIGRKPPGYYALAAAWLRLYPHWRSMTPAAQMHWLRILSAMLRLLTTATILFLAARLWPDAPQRQLGVGLLVGLAPMVGFIGGSLNNDALTILWGALTFSTLALARSRWAWALALALALIGPGLIDLSLLYLWPLVLVRWAFFAPSAAGARGIHLAQPPRWLLWMCGAASLLLLALLLPNPHRAAGWRWQNASRTRETGHLFLQAQDSPARIVQIISGKRILQRQGQLLTLSARVSGRGRELTLRLDDGQRSVETACPLSAQPRTCVLRLAPQSQYISVSALLPAGEAHLQLDLVDAAGAPLLDNGHGRTPAPLGQPLFIRLERTLPLPAGYFDHLLTAGVWDIPSLLRYGLYAAFTWASFWGDFGWLSRPYPWFTYLFLAAATLAAAIGIAQMLQNLLRGRSSPDAGILIFSLLAFSLILLQTWLPMLGHAWQPQGRYLFPALAPIAILLLLGWETLLGPRQRLLLPLLFLSLLLLNLQAWRIVA